MRRPAAALAISNLGSAAVVPVSHLRSGAVIPISLLCVGGSGRSKMMFRTTHTIHAPNGN